MKDENITDKISKVVEDKDITLIHRDSILDERGTLTIDKGCSINWKALLQKHMTEKGYTPSDTIEMILFVEKLFNHCFTNLLAEQKAEIIERVEKMPSASRDEVQNEKVICSDDVINLIKE